MEAALLEPVGARSCGFRDAARHPEFRWFLTHHLVGSTAQTFGTVAVAVALYDATGSAAWVAAAAACRLLPYLLLSGPAGALADRMDRRRLLWWSSVLRAAAVALTLVAVTTESPSWLVVALVFATTALGTGSFPALMAVLPSTVPARHLSPATALLNTVETAAWLVGPALGGLLLLDGRPAVALAVNAVLFLVSAALLAPTRPRPAVTHVERRPSLRHELAEGARTIARSPSILPALTLVLWVNVIVGAGPVVALECSEQLLGSGSDGYALLVLALGAGGFAGVVATNRLSSGTHIDRTLRWTAAAAAVPFALLAVPGTTLPLAMALMAVAGSGAVVTEVVALTSMLRSLPDHVAGRVFGLVDASLVAAVLLGSALAPLAISAIGIEATLVAVGCAVPAAAVTTSRLVGPWASRPPHGAPMALAVRSR